MPAVKLRQPLTLEECQLVRVWRNEPDVMPMLRTGYKSEAEQADFYRTVVQNKLSDHSYFAVESQGRFVGMAGLTYRHNGEAEISLILGPSARGRGVGTAAVGAVLEFATASALDVVRGVCLPRGHQSFWRAMYARTWDGWRPGFSCIDQLGTDPTSFRWTWERTA